MTGSQVTIVAWMKAKPGCEERLRKELLELVAQTRREEGCINYDLHRSGTEAGVFLFYENWVSKEHLERHAASRHIQAFRAKAGELLAEPTEITMWEMVSKP